jgi:hypothetical protein
MSDKLRYNLTDHLTDREVDRLLDLFNKIKLDLSASSFPTRTNRLEAVENMKRVLEIHNYEIRNTQGRRHNVNKSKNRNNAEER